MDGVRKYFKEESELRMLVLDHLKPSDFYLSAWQGNRSATPLLVLRTLLFLMSAGIVLASMTIYIINDKYQFWFIYLTHWGLSVMTIATGFGAAVSLRCYCYGPLNPSLRLPWYVRAYWVFYNVAVPVAFLITVFYWTVLYEAGIEEELNHGLDVAVHGLNSVVVFLLLITSSQPSRLLHFYQPLLFAVTFFIFGLIYYLAGGVDKKGFPYIYPVLDWQYPGRAIGVGVLTGLLLIVLYFMTVTIAQGRDAISKKYIKPEAIPAEGVPLRRPVHTAV